MKDVMITVVTVAMWLIVAASFFSIFRTAHPWGGRELNREELTERWYTAGWRKTRPADDEAPTDTRLNVCWDAALQLTSTVGGRCERIRPMVAVAQRWTAKAAEPLIAPFRPLRLNVAVTPATVSGDRRVALRAPYETSTHSLDLAPLLAGLVLTGLRLGLMML